MNSDYWRRGVAAVLTAGLLTAGAIAQDGASGEVEIEGQAPATTTKEPLVKAKKAVKPEITDRDPFVNTIASGDVVGTVGIRRSTSAGGASVKAQKSSGGDDAVTEDDLGDDLSAEDVEVVEIIAPEVTVNGIVGSGSGRQAIVVDASGSTHIVRAGQKIGEVYVSSVDSKSITLVHQGKSFDYPMANEFEVK